MGMEFPDTRRKADNSYRARSAGGSVHAAGLVALTEGTRMAQIPTSLSIAIWLTGSIWIVGFIAYLGDAPGELVIATLLAGLAAGGFELRNATPSRKKLSSNGFFSTGKSTFFRRDRSDGHRLSRNLGSM
jgi:hypothetical protein